MGRIKGRHFDPLSTSRQAPGEISQTGGAGIFGLFGEGKIFPCAAVEMTPYFELCSSTRQCLVYPSCVEDGNFVEFLH